MSHDDNGKRTEEADESGASGVSSDRRKALARLGLAAGAVYAAPTLMRIDRSAAQKKGASPGAKKD